MIAVKRARMRDAGTIEQIRLLTEIATIYDGHLGNHDKAISALRDALVFVAHDRAVLQRLQDMYAKLERWDAVIATIKEFIELERQPIRKGMYHHAAATIYRDALGAIDLALTHFRLALDAFLTNSTMLDEVSFSHAVSSFEGVDAIVVARGEWQGQKGTYIATLERLGDARFDVPAIRVFRMRLLDGLAAIYKTRLQLLPAAIVELQRRNES